MIFSFRYPILLWSLGAWPLGYIAIGLQIVLKWVWHVFSPTIRVKDFYFWRKLGLNKSMEKFESGKDFIFWSQKIDPSEATIIINKSYEIFIMSMRYNRCHPPNITVDDFKRLCYIRLMCWKRQNFTFTKFTRNTIKVNNIERWIVFISKIIRFEQVMKYICVWMSKTLMPHLVINNSRITRNLQKLLKGLEHLHIKKKKTTGKLTFHS